MPPAESPDPATHDGPGLRPTLGAPPPALPDLSVEATNERTRAVGSVDGRSARRTRSGKGSEPRRRPRTGRFPAAAAMAALALALGIGAVAGRATVVQAFPSAAHLYAAIGLPVNLRGLAFRGMRSEISAADGTSVLVVEGEIENVAGAPVDVPKIEIAVQGADGQALYTWTNDPPRRTLERAETAWFRARLASPPAEGRQILVRFAPAHAGAVGDAGSRP